MLTDALLVLLGTLLACGLVLYAVLELIWPTDQVARSRSGPRPPSARPVASNIGPGHVVPVRDVAGESRGAEGPSAIEAPETQGPTREVPAAPPPAAAVRPPRGEPRPATVVMRSGAEPPPQQDLLPAVEDEVALPPRSPFEQCQALFESGRFVDVVTQATAALAAGEDAAPSPREQAALWSVVGRARERLGDHDAARTALERAIDAAPESERDAFRVQLASLGLSVASDILSRCRGLPDERRVTMLRDARMWLERAQKERPTDEGIAAARDAVSTGYWSATESVIRGLVRRQEFAAARARLVEALPDPGIPAVTREAFEELHAEVLGSEIGQLTASAIRETQQGREWEVLSTLEQAETLLRESGAALRPERRDEIARRLWLAYTKAGMRRVEQGEPDDAVKMLLRALGYAGDDEARRQEPGAALAEAVRRVVEDRAAVIREVAEMGNRESARVQVDKLVELLDSVLRAGVAEDAVADVCATVRALDAELA